MKHSRSDLSTSILGDKPKSVSSEADVDPDRAPSPDIVSQEPEAEPEVPAPPEPVPEPEPALPEAPPAEEPKPSKVRSLFECFNTWRLLTKHWHVNTFWFDIFYAFMCTIWRIQGYKII